MGDGRGGKQSQDKDKKMDRQPLEEIRLLRAELDTSPFLLNRQLLSFTGAPYLKGTNVYSPIAPLTLSSSPRAW